ncbi:MAG TPA: glutathione peroxidase, partial [Rhodopila sp.]
MIEPTRRTLLALTGGVFLMAADNNEGAWAFSFPSIDGGTLDLNAFRGRVLLVTNTASFCGYTYQYDGLEKLHTAKSAAGLTVIGVPSQDFNQESPDNATVKTFCET